MDDQFRPNRFTRLNIEPDPQRPQTVAIVQVIRTSRPDPEQATEVDHENGAVTAITWNDWHREHPQEWTPAAEAWMRDWVADRYGTDGGDR